MEPYKLSEAEVAQLGNFTQSSIAFGPLAINWTFDLKNLEFKVSVTLAGIPIGEVAINPAHPSAKLGGSVGPFTAEVVLTADFAKRQLNYKVLVKAFGIIVVDKQGILFSW